MSPQVLHLGRHAGLLSEKVHVGRSKNLVKPIEEANGPLSKIPLILNLGALLARIRLWGFLIVYMYKEHEGLILAVVETAGRLRHRSSWQGACRYIVALLFVVLVVLTFYSYSSFCCYFYLLFITIKCYSYYYNCDDHYNYVNHGC